MRYVISTCFGAAVGTLGAWAAETQGLWWAGGLAAAAFVLYFARAALETRA